MPDRNSLTDNQCRVCRSTALVACIDLHDVPVYCNALYATRKAALDVIRGDIRLVFCRHCGHVFNKAFDPAPVDYSVDYENSLHSSARFRSYAANTARHLVERYDLHGKKVLEIGCGQGEFLTLLCEGGGNRGIGVDPSLTVAAGERSPHPRVELIRDYYSRRFADPEIDLICCRHVLEHMAAPGGLLKEVWETIAGSTGTIVFFEVPNVLYTLRDMGIWDVIYEHCSYFSPSSLARIFRRCGFEVLDVRAVYDDQFLCIEARAATALTSTSCGTDAEIEELTDLVTAFGSRYRDKVTSWEREIVRLTESGRRLAVWGGGSKGVTFLNTVTAGKRVDCVVDINRHKQGLFIPGTGQPIVAPHELIERNIDVILVMNPIYREEIEAQVRALDLAVEIFCV